MSNAYYGPNLPTTQFDLFVLENAQHCECLNRFNKTRQQLETSFHKNVSPDKFAKLLRQTWARLDNTYSLGNVPSTLTVCDQHRLESLSEFAGDRSIHFYRTEV